MTPDPNGEGGKRTCEHCGRATYVPETCPSCHQVVCGVCWEEAVGPVVGRGERAVIWLRVLLAASPLAAKNVKAAATRARIAWRTVERAKKTAGVESIERPYGWIWRRSVSNQNSEVKSRDLAVWGSDAAKSEKASWCKGMQRIQAKLVGGMRERSE